MSGEVTLDKLVTILKDIEELMPLSCPEGIDVSPDLYEELLRRFAAASPIRPIPSVILGVRIYVDCTLPVDSWKRHAR